MPNGIYTKEQIREIAQKLELIVANKPDSQEICFIPDNNYSKFIREYTNKKIKKGNFIDTKGNVLGKHNGIINYTIGQRKGLGITFGKPKYVVDIDATNNTVVLGDGDEVYSNELIAKDINFISIDKLTDAMKVTAKIRSTAKEAEATIYKMEDGNVKVVFSKPQRAVTKGQAIVFYSGNVVVGGGTIA